MKRLLVRMALLLAFVHLFTLTSYAETLKGKIGTSSKWGSGWIILDKSVDFKRGDKIKLLLGGTAKKVLVRFLANGETADKPIGIEGGVINVPKNKIVLITISKEYKNVKQLSVHGGRNPWGLYPLGDNNGTATIMRVDYKAQ